MDVFFTVLAAAFTGVVLSVILKKDSAQWSTVVAIGAGCVLLLIILQPMKQVIDVLAQISEKGDIGSKWLPPVLKITGVAIVGEWGIHVCKDAGEAAMAFKLELGTKIVILVLCMPVLLELLDLVQNLLSTGALS